VRRPHIAFTLRSFFRTCPFLCRNCDFRPSPPPIVFLFLLSFLPLKLFCFSSHLSLDPLRVDGISSLPRPFPFSNVEGRSPETTHHPFSRLSVSPFLRPDSPFLPFCFLVFWVCGHPLYYVLPPSKPPSPHNDMINNSQGLMLDCPT